MLDTKNIKSVQQKGLAMADSAHEKAQTSFMSGVSEMQVEGPGNAAAIASSVSGIQASMTENMQAIVQGLKDDVARRQAGQRSQKSSDFVVGKPDLRSTSSYGFPDEKPDFFDNLSK